MNSEKFIEAFELCSVKNIDCENCKYDKTDYCANGNIEVLEFMKTQQATIAEYERKIADGEVARIIKIANKRF